MQELAHDGKVICVQLSLFADMMKGREWTPASLQEVGGTSGVGVAFLDETFASRTAPPTHRLHAKAAQAVLKALLPEVGTDIKGQMQPAERLLECSGYANRPDDFQDLLRILNTELRLITPTDPEEAEAWKTNGSSSDCRADQLLSTDPRLSRAVAARLADAQAEGNTTRPGGAEAGRASGAVERQAGEPTPSLVVGIPEHPAVCTERRNGPSRSEMMMRRARFVHGTRWALALSFFCCLQT